MGKAYSMDLRQRVFDYITVGHSCRAAARVFGVSPSTAVRLAAGFRDLGTIAPKRQGRAPGTAGKLVSHMVFLTGIVAAEPDITLRELSGARVETHGLQVELSSIHRALARAGLSYKKRPDRAGTPAGRPATGAA